MSGRLRRCLAAGAAAVAVSLLALPASGRGAVAAVQDDVLATVALADVEARLGLIQASGARVTRVDVFWSTVAPSRPARPQSPADPAYDFRVTDAILIGLRQRGIALARAARCRATSGS